MWEISRHPTIQRRLQQELRTLSTPIMFPSADRQLPDAKKLDALRLLHAVIKESLRLRPSFPGGQPRLTPVSTTTTLGSFENIPPNVRVNVYAWRLHRNPDMFPNPEQWQPERWMDDEEVKAKTEGDDKKERWFWAFGSGSRMCLGSNLAMQGTAAPFVIYEVDLNAHVLCLNSDEIHDRCHLHKLYN